MRLAVARSPNRRHPCHANSGNRAKISAGVRSCTPARSTKNIMIHPAHATLTTINWRERPICCPDAIHADDDRNCSGTRGQRPELKCRQSSAAKVRAAVFRFCLRSASFLRLGWRSGRPSCIIGGAIEDVRGSVQGGEKALTLGANRDAGSNYRGIVQGPGRFAERGSPGSHSGNSGQRFKQRGKSVQIQSPFQLVLALTCIGGKG